MPLTLVSLSTDPTPDLLRTRIGQALRQTRIAQSKTLQNVADEANLSRSHLSDIERGRKEASSEVIRSIHQSLNLSIDDLLDRASHSSNQGLCLAA